MHGLLHDIGIAVIREVWEQMQKQGPTAKAMDDAKTYLIGSFPLQLTSTGAIAAMSTRGPPSGPERSSGAFNVDGTADGVAVRGPGLEARRLVRERRARTHEGHRAAQDVEQLRQLVERVAAQEAADARHPRVAADLEQRAGGLVVGLQVGLQLVGVMTMAAHETDPAKVRQSFSRTREIFEELRWHKIGGPALRHLSMGMSNDFEMAIAEGATMVRIGTGIFGSRRS